MISESGEPSGPTEKKELARTRELPPEVDWEPGTLVAGRYRIQRLLGSGGMGLVFLGQDLFLGKEVAVKALRPSLAADEGNIDRFRTEVALAHTVTHPNIVRIFDLGEFDGILYFSMEYLEGISLKQHLREAGKLAQREVREIALAICRALSAAHRAHVVHRDLKPSNIMLVEDGRKVVVMDFGISSHFHEEGGPSSDSEVSGEKKDSEGTSLLMGTPKYMSPEQWQNKPCTPASDLYSLGAILFQCLAGRPPFKSGEGSVAVAHLKRDPPRLRTLDPAIPRSLDAAIARCLQKDPADRCRSAGELAQAIGPRKALSVWARFAFRALTTLAIMAGLGWGLVEIAKKAIIVEMGPAVKRLAQLAAQGVSFEDLERIGSATPGESKTAEEVSPEDVERIRASADFRRIRSSDEFKRVHDHIRRVSAENPEVKFIYTLRKLEGEHDWEFVVDRDVDPVDLDGDGEADLEDKAEMGTFPGLKYVWDESPEMKQTVDDLVPRHDPEFSADEFGFVLSGYAPIGDRKGTGGYILGVDMDNSRLTSFRNVVHTSCLAAWFLLLLAPVVVEQLATRRRARTSSPGLALDA
ncbi:MAG: serine/threonine protein kinase [Planctomycetes bacterium]|nr:serine/threonine protein kinase [Planctomycetota bacterium]